MPRGFATRAEYAHYIKLMVHELEHKDQEAKEEAELRAKENEENPDFQDTILTGEGSNLEDYIRDEDGESDNKEGSPQRRDCRYDSPYFVHLKYQSGKPVTVADRKGKRLAPSYDFNTLGLASRLMRPGKPRLAPIIERVPKPRGLLPPPDLCMPRWKDVPVDQKLPQLPGPSDKVYFSRGKLGQQLSRRKQTTFTVADEYNRVKLLRTPYNALHDPHTRAYFEKPAVQELLYKQGLITEDGKVVCNVRQFNSYRSFVGEQYKEKVLTSIREEAEIEKDRREELLQLERFYRSIPDEAGIVKQKRAQLAKARKKQAIEWRRRRAEDRIREKEQKFELFLEKKDEKAQFQKFMCGLNNQERYAVYKRSKMVGWNEKARTIIRIMKREEVIPERLNFDKIIAREMMYMLKFDRFKKRFRASRKKVRFLQFIESALEVNSEIKAWERQNRYNDHRERIEQKEQNKKHTELLKIDVGNFFHHWLSKTRKAIKERNDDGHQTVFKTEKSLEAYTRMILSNFENVNKDKDFERARKKLLATMYADGTGGADFPIGWAASKSKSTNIGSMLTWPEDDWYAAEHRPRTRQLFSFRVRGYGQWPKRKPKNFVRGNVAELKELDAKCQRKRREEEEEQINQAKRALELRKRKRFGSSMSKTTKPKEEVALELKPWLREASPVPSDDYLTNYPTNPEAQVLLPPGTDPESTSFHILFDEELDPTVAIINTLKDSEGQVRRRTISIDDGKTRIRRVLKPNELLH